MITRMVLVEFNEDAPEEAIQTYEDEKKKLEKLPCVKRMVSGLGFIPEKEAGTQKIMDRVTFPQSLSYWEFEDEAGLDDFLTAPVHLEMVKLDFIRHIKRRYVGNLET